MSRKSITNKLEESIYKEIQLLALELSNGGKRIFANDLLEEGMEIILKKYGKTLDVDKETL